MYTIYIPQYTLFCIHNHTRGKEHRPFTYEKGKQTDISKLMFIPRNDENFIWPGDNYELFFQKGNKGWQSLGKQTATGSELKFTVPEGALFWLCNLTKGHGEQIFLIKDGQQIFSHDINFSKE